MSTEKIIGNQAKESLKGNWAKVIAAVLFVCAVIVFLIFSLQFFYYGFKLVNIDTNKVVKTKEAVYSLVTTVFVLVGCLVTPLINGVYKMFYDISRRGNTEIRDLFYYFCSARRYFKTLLLNLILTAVYSVVSIGLDIYAYASALTGTSIGSISDLNNPTAFLLALAAIASAVIKIIAYLVLVNGSLFAYAASDVMPLSYYTFGMYGFSVRHFKESAKLLFSFLGWIALCFFVVPAFYVLPYIMTSFATSAKWLFALEKDRGLLC